MFHTADAPSLDDGREVKSLNGFGSKDQAVLRFRTASLAIRGAVRTRAEVLHDLAIVRSRWDFRSFISLFRQAVELGSTNTTSCQAASPPGNSCFPRTYSTRSRTGFFLMRVNRVSGCLRQIAFSSSRTVITPSRNGY